MSQILEINSKISPKTCIIWLHGLGDSGDNFSNIAAELDLPDTFPIRFLFPNAPLRPVTLNRGFVMPAWFDIGEIASGAQEDETGIKKAAHTLHHLIENEIQRGIAPEKIFLAGFSQGGALALYTGLRYSKRLGGILALSTYMPLAHTLTIEMNPINKALPIFIGHGQFDPLIPLSWAENNRDQLKALDYAIDWHVYPMEHSVCPKETQDIAAWIKRNSH